MELNATFNNILMI